MHSKLVRTPGLYLIGFMGCGKTAVGFMLADELGWNFIDLDGDIEAAAGKTISRIFETEGEEAFRAMEHEALSRRVHEVRLGQPSVISLGGGAFAEQRNYDLVSDSGISIWLDCPLETIRERVAGEQHRPLAQEPARFTRLYHERKPSYARADFRIEATEEDPRAIVEKILSLPLF